MKIVEAIKTLNEEEQISYLACPVCKTRWIEERFDDSFERKECSHLRFVLTEGGPEYYGQWDTESFEKAYAKAYAEIDGSEEDEIYFDGVDEEALARVEIDDVDEALSLTEGDYTCGPCFFTTLWGYKKD